MAERCKVPNAPKVIWAVKATESFNSEIVTALKVFQAYNELETTGIPDAPTINKLKSFKQK